jgi:hypothetical protein
MSDLPPPPQPSAARAPRAGGSVLLGIVAGVLFIGVFVGLGFLLAASVPAVGGFLLWIPPLVCLVAGIVLTAMPRTTRFGAGLLIGFGIALLASAGVCVALITGIGH